MRRSPYHNISVIIPMQNEAENVKPLLTEVKEALHDQDNLEIIVIDDGSTDSTYTTLCEIKSLIPELRIIRHLKNYGQTAGIISGVKAAKHDWIATLDGDGQNDPADIPKLMKAVEQDANDQPLLVAGIRAKRDDRLVRRVSSRIANGAVSLFLKDNCPDTGCGLKLFCREDFLSLPHFNHLHRFLPALFKRAGGKVIHIPVNHRPRMRGQSKYGIMNRLWVGIADLFGVAWLIRRQCKPELRNEHP